MATRQTLIDLGVDADLGFDIKVNPTAEPLLTDEMRQIVRGALPIIRRQAERHGIPNGTVQIWGFVSAEEDDQQIVLYHVAHVDRKTASEYQDDLANDIHAWKRALPEQYRALAIDGLVIGVWPDGE